MDVRSNAYPGYTAPNRVPPQASHQPVTDAPVKDYLALSVVTFFCCWPLGIVALVKSMEVKRHNDTGMYDDAKKASKRASLFVKIGISIGSTLWAVFAVFAVLTIIVNIVAAALS